MSTTAKSLKPNQRVTKRNLKKKEDKNDLDEPVLEADMTHWKYMWNDILSDPDFREWFLGSDSYGYYQLFKLDKTANPSSVDKQKKGIEPQVDPSKKKGTFYMKFGTLGHYVAYEIKKDTISLFDSSHGEHGRYADCLPPFIGTIEKYFNKEIQFVEKFGTLQVLPGDSFCQTWSLSYLLGKPTQTIMMKAPTLGEIEVLYKLCKYIIALPVFEEICTQQEAWIKREFKRNKAPKKWTPEYFFMFSRQRMNLESFHYLFN